MMKRIRQRSSLILVGLAVLLVTTASWVAVADGGPPPDRSSGGKTYKPVIESWRLHQGNLTLCDDENTCHRDALVQASQTGECSWSGRVWLASGGNSYFLHSLSTEGYAVIQKTTTGGPTMTFDFHIGNVWWRSAAKHANVSLTIPCDTKIVSLTFNVKGETLMGRNDSGAQNTDIVLHSDPWEYPEN